MCENLYITYTSNSMLCNVLFIGAFPFARLLISTTSFSEVGKVKKVENSLVVLSNIELIVIVVLVLGGGWGGRGLRAMLTRKLENRVVGYVDEEVAEG